MGLGESRAEKIQRCSDQTRERIQNMKSKKTTFEREEKKLTTELIRIPSNKPNDIRAKAKNIAAVRVRMAMAENTIVQLEAMDQNFQNLALQNDLVGDMVDTNQLMKEINEDTAMRNVNQLVNAFQRSITAMATDQANLSGILEDSLQGIESNTEEIVGQILQEHNIQLNLENQRLNATFHAAAQPQLQPQSQASVVMTATGAANAPVAPTIVTTSNPLQGQLERFQALKKNDED